MDKLCQGTIAANSEEATYIFSRSWSNSNPFDLNKLNVFILANQLTKNVVMYPHLNKQGAYLDNTCEYYNATLGYALERAMHIRYLVKTNPNSVDKVDIIGASYLLEQFADIVGGRCTTMAKTQDVAGGAAGVSVSSAVGTMSAGATAGVIAGVVVVVIAAVLVVVTVRRRAAKTTRAAAGAQTAFEWDDDLAAALPPSQTADMEWDDDMSQA